MATTKSTVEVQRILLNFILSCPTLYTRIQNIYNPENFDRSLKSAAKFIGEHAQKHNTIPTPEQVNAVSNCNLELIADIQDGHQEWFLEEFEQFTKFSELERAILASADLLEKGDFEPIEKLIKDAVQISLTRDLGIEYYYEPRERLMRLKNSNGQVSTGWKDIDDKLYGGISRGELNIFCGAPGAGKSLFLQNLSLNWMLAGLNGIYITSELSADLVAMRIDSMLTGTGSKEIFKNLDDVELKIGMASKSSGRLKIKFLPSGSTVNHIRSYVKELAIQEGYRFDFMCVDYLDLFMPGTAKVDVSDVFTKDKLVCEEMRNFSIELRALTATASQLNRTSFDELDFSLASIAGGISKLNTADTLFGIFTSRSMKERGAIQLQLMKTRNSSGVGSKVDLDFNVNTLRISTGTGANTEESTMSGSNILAKIKNGAAKTPVGSGPIGDKKDLLKDLLTNMKKKKD